MVGIRLIGTSIDAISANTHGSQMNKMLFDFYTGRDTDHRGRSFDDMINMSDLELERSHDVVQWLFPLKEKSAHNPAAPLLDDETVQAILDDAFGYANLTMACIRFLKFLSQDEADKPTWITRRNHNFLRITRIIKCYRLFGEPVAESFYKLAIRFHQKFPDIIGPETLEFWQEANTTAAVAKFRGTFDRDVCGR